MKMEFALLYSGVLCSVVVLTLVSVSVAPLYRLGRQARPDRREISRLLRFLFFLRWGGGERKREKRPRLARSGERRGYAKSGGVIGDD